MPKKSKKKPKVKQIPAKAGAKAKVGSGGKVEVVLKTTKVVKDARRGSYKPRKKTNKKQDASKQQQDAIQLLRDQIELEKLQALQRQAQSVQPSQRTQNRRTGGDINQFFKDSKNTGKTEVISDLAKQVKALREELKKKDEVKPKEDAKPKEEKSKFKEELETTQNEIQRQRIQRGIARRDEEQREKNLQKRIKKLEEEEKEKERKDDLNRISKSTLRLGRNPPTGIQKDESGKITGLVLKEKPLSTATFQRDERLSLLTGRRPKSQAINRTVRKSVPEPVPEPEPAPQRFKVGGKVEVPFSSQEDLLKAFRNRKDKPRPLPKEKSITEVKSDIVSSLDNQPKLAKERERERLVQQKLEIIRDREQDDSGFQTADEEEPTEDKRDIAKDLVGELISGAGEKIEERLEPVSPRVKQRRESFLQEVKSPEVEEKVQSQLKIEAEKLRELQESGDKAYADRVQAQLDIEQDERVARDLLYKQARTREYNLETQEVDDEMRRLKDKKKAEKKKARDNLRKREQEEFLDDVAGDIIRGAVDQNIGERKASKNVSSQFLNKILTESGGKSLANEVITATQNIPRSRGKYSQEKEDESIAELLVEKKLKSYTRRAYTPEEAKEFIDNKRQASDLKEKIALAFPEIRQSNYDKEMYRKDPNKDKLRKQVKEDMDKAKASGKYSGLQLVKLQTLLDRLVEQLSAIKLKEGQKRDRKSTGGETEEERELRKRLEERERENAGQQPIIEDDDDDVDLDEI